MTAAPPQAFPRRVEPSELDYSALDQNDLENLILQRSGVLSDVPRAGEVIRQWAQGEPTRLSAEANSRGLILAQRAARMIQTEFEQLTPLLDELRPTKIADIGCGYGFFDLYAHARYGCDLLLIDIEKNQQRHFGYEEEAAAYSNLHTARNLLIANGVPPEQVTTWNPQAGDDLDDGQKPDLAVSFLACGYHFPVDMYLPFFRFGVAPGGTLLLDVRNGSFDQSRRALRKLGKMKVLYKGRGRRRVMVRKGKG